MRAIFEPFCTVLEARSAREALEICAERTPDLVVANLMLPYENGNVLLAALRAHAAREMQMVPLIMLTPHDDWRPVHALAADDYLARPFNARELLSRGHMQLQLGKRRRDLEARFEERTAELRALMDESPMGIIRCNSQGVLTYANAAW
jgi:DNA-binding response OmpR family regulator